MSKSNPNVIIEKLKQKCEMQKKVIRELDAKVRDGLQREENLRFSLDQSTAGKYG